MCILSKEFEPIQGEYSQKLYLKVLITLLDILSKEPALILFDCKHPNLNIFYFQSYMLKTSSSTEYIHINSYINGNDKQDFTIYFYNTGSTTYATPEITKIVRLAANDTFGFRLYSNQTNVFKIYPNYTCFAGYLLG